MAAMDGNNEQWLSSGQLAAAAGVSTDTLRHYERVGVLARAERLTNGYRRYPAGTLQRLALIRNALGLGFTLQELAVILQQREAGTPPCRRVHVLATEKLADLERHIIELTRLRDTMRSTLERWSAELDSTPGGQPAHLLEKLSAHTITALESTGAAPRAGAAPFSIRRQKEKS
jgi:MerR family copper efflux transcriptional regulator